MSDTRAAMREFRFLDEKRTRGNLSPTEETRLNELRGALAGQGEPVQETSAPADLAQQPQGYYGADGQWYAYPADYTPDPNAGYDAAYTQQPQGYYGTDGQWYAYAAQGYDATQGQTQQPQGYYGADGQWYTYPDQGYDATQGYAQQEQPQGYYGTDGQWYAYPTQGYDPHQPYDPNQGYADPQGQPYTAEPAQAYAAEPVQQPPAPAPLSTPTYVPQPAPPVKDPVDITLESENLDIPALSAPAPWADAEDPEPTLPSAQRLDMSQESTEDIFEVTDTDVTPVSEATPIPERLDEPEVVDLSGWEEPAAAEPESGPIELGEDDFSSLNADAAEPSRLSSPPVDDAPLVPVRTVEVMPSDIEELENAVDEQSSTAHEPAMLEFSEAEPALTEEPSAPLVDEWTSAPLAVDDQESGRSAPPTYDAASDYGEPVTEPEQHADDAESSDVALLENPMEVTASYAIPAYPEGDVALLDPAGQAPATGQDASAPVLSLTTSDERPTLELSAIEAEPSTSAAPPVDMPWDTSEELVAYEANTPEESAPAPEGGSETPTFDMADVGAEIEPSAPAPTFPSEEHVPSLELRPVQVAPDLQADTVELTDSYDPEAAQPAYDAAPTADPTFDLSGDPNEPLPLASANEFLGHSEQTGAEVSSEPVPLETADTGASWSGDEGVSAESIPLESAAEYVSSPEFISASTTWGHQPGSEEPSAELSAEEAPENTTAFGTSLSADAEAESLEAQPEWSTPVEEQPVLEAQPEWASEEPAAPAEAQPEWSAPVEEQPVLEAQPEWSAPVEEQPVLEAQPEWTSCEEPAAPTEAQPEWVSSEEQPVLDAQPEWTSSEEPAAPAEAQPEWAAAEEQPVMEAQPEWASEEPAAPAEAQPEWAAAEEQPVLDAQPEWTSDRK
ncbi:hypothetical protein [Archangium sp.]|uniref:hypothetical protein n=1 Tax=Archangium sp. TaxID=1872627 RepID=UPI00286BD78B|nr:hypothetical protein [Archangium sp.]